MANLPKNSLENHNRIDNIGSFHLMKKEKYIFIFIENKMSIFIEKLIKKLEIDLHRYIVISIH